MTQKNMLSAKKELLLIIFIPVLIVLLSSVMYFTGIGAPESTANKGILVVPPRLAADYGIEFAIDTDTSKPIFTLLQLSNGACDAACADDLYYSRQLITALGRYRIGLKRALWQPATVSLSDELIEEHPKLEVSVLPDDILLSDWLKDIDNVRYLLIDSRGFLMMYYTPEQDYKDIHKDLKFLLKNSGY